MLRPCAQPDPPGYPSRRACHQAPIHYHSPSMSTAQTTAPGFDRTTNRILKFYKFHARIYDQTRWLILYGRNSAVDALGLQPGQSVMEVGCGTGSNFRHLVRAVGPSGSVTGVDASEHMLGVARKRIHRNGWNNVHARLADASELSLGERFDAILFGYSAAVIPRWEQAIEHAAQHLKPHGTLGILEFGTFKRWPRPIGFIAKKWLSRNHVKVHRPIEAHMRRCLHDVRVQRRFGDYYFIATGKHPLAANKLPA